MDSPTAVLVVFGVIGYLILRHCCHRTHRPDLLKCIELKTGKVAWSVDDFKAGTITLAAGHLLVLREGGELLAAPASPKGFQPVAKAQVLPATVRSYPAIADGRIYIRNEKTLICLDLRKK